MEGCRKAGKESGVRECGRRPKHGAGLLPCMVIGKKLREVAAPVEQRQRCGWNDNEKLNQLLFRNRARSFQTVENQCFAASHTAHRSPARLLPGNRSRSMSLSFRAAPARYRSAGCEENHRCRQIKQDSPRCQWRRSRRANLVSPHGARLQGSYQASCAAACRIRGEGSLRHKGICVV